MKNIGKVLGGLGFVIVLAVAWLYQNGGLSKFTHSQDTAQVAQTPAVDTGTPAPVAQPAPVVTQANYKPDTDTLKSIINNGVVRISVENPSQPFYDSENGSTPHGFNVDFAKLLFADPAFTSGGKQIQIDTRHEVDTYAGVPRQLLATAADGSHTVDIAMDGLTFADNTPSGVVYTIPYIDDFGYALIVRNGSAIHTAADLAGKRIGILKGDPDVRSYVSDQFPDSTIVTVSDADSAFIQKSLDKSSSEPGAVDAFIYDYPFAVSAIKNTDLQFAVTKLDGSSLSYKIGVRAQDQSLLIYLNAAIAKVKASPAYLDLLRQYFISNQASTRSASGGERSYAVKSRDTLNLIAASQLGNGNRYREIQKRNNLPNPNLITVGQNLVIPAK
jgi:ABC-type amino acid transport substrate-binding protein